MEVSLSVFLRGVLVSFFLPFLLLTVSLALAACTQETSWNELNAKVVTLYQQGRYAEGVKVAKDALKVAEATFGPDHPAMGTSLNNLAALYKAQGKYAAAEPLYKRALAIWEKPWGQIIPMWRLP
ncbi:MAG: tetratricopeptide repeat protein [Dehalococcoidia bacterium]